MPWTPLWLLDKRPVITESSRVAVIEVVKQTGLAQPVSEFTQPTNPQCFFLKKKLHDQNHGNRKIDSGHFLNTGEWLVVENGFNACAELANFLLT